MYKLITIFCFLSSLFVNAQIIDNQNKLPATLEMIMQVKQFNQFLERFNYERLYDNIKLDSLFKSQYNRAKAIDLLFNQQDTRIESTDYEKLKNEFIKRVIDNNTKINRHLENIYIQALCNVKLNSKPAEIFLILKKEISPDSASSWVIVGASGDCISVKPSKDNKTSFIPPNSNETNFIKLNSVFNDKNNISSYTSDFKADELSILYYNISKGNISFEHVKQLTYFVFSVEKWVFSVKEFNRSTTNSGWLIENLERLNESKSDYLKRVLNVTR